MEKIEIPQTVTHIYSGAFEECSSLVNVTIPKSVKMIEAQAFKDCRKLESVVVEDTNNWRSYDDSYDKTGTPIDVTDPAINAANLKKEWGSERWEKN